MFLHFVVCVELAHLSSLDFLHTPFGLLPPNQSQSISWYAYAEFSSARPPSVIPNSVLQCKNPQASAEGGMTEGRCSLRDTSMFPSVHL